MLRKTNDGSLTLYNESFNELYHSEDGALLEARSLYIMGSGFNSLCLEENKDLNTIIKVCDVGLGLGYNALSTLEAWFSGKGLFSLEIHSLEQDKKLFFELTTGKASWEESWDDSWCERVKDFEEITPSFFKKVFEHPISRKKALWFVHLGEAKTLLKENKEKLPHFDFIWQDPFSPKTSPGLWDKEWFSLLTKFSTKNATLMTYSVARSVRDSLAENNWSFKKIPTVTKKKVWLKAIKEN